jgi:hypothetical protein
MSVIHSADQSVRHSLQPRQVNITNRLIDGRSQLCEMGVADCRHILKVGVFATKVTKNAYSSFSMRACLSVLSGCPCTY